MLTKIIKMDSENPEFSKVREAADILKSGGLLAFPTETVYGLGANALDKTAAQRIYSAKGRPSDNPLIVHISNLEMLEKLTTNTPDTVFKLAENFWPGPLTIILNKSKIVPKETTGGLDTVAVRMPSRKSARLIIEESKLPIAAPSANISGRPSPTLASHVIEDFNGKIQGIVDDGPSPIGLESTILDLTSDIPVILRKGYIRALEIENVLGTEVSDSVGSKDSDKPKAPGMKYKHYAPRGELSLVPDKQLINDLILQERPGKTAVITCEENKDFYQKCAVYSLGSRKNGREIMQNLYATLRRLDEDHIDIAYAETFYDIEYGDAIMDRLGRACGGRIINKNED